MMKWKRYIILFFFITLLLFIIVLRIAPTEKWQEFKMKSSISQHEIPEEYIDLYQEAANEYDIPWELLASVHRVETIFSTMDPLVSPVGALGHFQFMPRTWVGWTYPGGDLGEIDEDVDITDLALIEEHGGYGVDGNGDGIADPFDIVDAAYSAAKYLSKYGASEGNYEEALFAYNKSDDYVEEVMMYFNTYQENYETFTLQE
ncbi:hypothetical protein BTS2_3719 [Bacillus sp. TS-2]|nr:hypothetical protein BTS2_3719 [Bacillus sp. TS-2]